MERPRRKHELDRPLDEFSYSSAFLKTPRSELADPSIAKVSFAPIDPGRNGDFGINWRFGEFWNMIAQELCKRML